MEEKTLEQLAREARNKYFRDLRNKNPERTKQTLERYWIKKALALQAEQNEKEKENDNSTQN